ncbi:MAG: mechanosensitive ion channel family protein [Actinomycetota bacterium]|nr:mechanosensitive ion channel family protein [Actinomycetota bacterium]
MDYLNELWKGIPLTQLLISLGVVVGGTLIGLIFEKVALKRLYRMVRQTAWNGDTIIIYSLRHVVTIWFALASIYFVILRRDIDQTLAGLFKNILLIIFTISIALVLARIAAGFIRLYFNQVQGLPSSSLITNVVRITIAVLAALVILQSLGIRITPILGALGVGGLAVALALQETLANLFAGIVIILSKQLRPNDFVELSSGEQGYVEDISWRNTTIRSLPNNMIIVPNAEISSSIITNYYQPEQQMSVLIPVGVSYMSDLEHVEKVTVEVATEVMTEIEGGVPEEEPFIRYNNFGDFSIDFTLIMQTTEVVNQYLIKHEFIKRLHKRYGEEGIEIPFPIRTIQSMDGSNGKSDGPWTKEVSHQEDRRSSN